MTWFKFTVTVVSCFSTCEAVVKNRTDNCALCQCKFENRNTTTIKVRYSQFTKLSLIRP